METWHPLEIGEYRSPRMPQNQRYGCPKYRLADIGRRLRSGSAQTVGTSRSGHSAPTQTYAPASPTVRAFLRLCRAATRSIIEGNYRRRNMYTVPMTPCPICERPTPDADMVRHPYLTTGPHSILVMVDQIPAIRFRKEVNLHVYLFLLTLRA